MSEYTTETAGGVTVTRLAVTPVPMPPARHISVGAFFDRFGAAKWAILADSAPGVQAVVMDASVRDYIDLDNPELPAGLAVITAAGHSINETAILTNAIQAKELP